MDTIVTARVPVELKEQGNQILSSIGATQTELINAAYRYVITEKKLPESKSSSTLSKASRKKLTKEARSRLKRSLDQMNLNK